MTFDGTINVAHVISIAVLLATVLGSYYRLDKRLSVLEELVKNEVRHIWRALDKDNDKTEGGK